MFKNLLEKQQGKVQEAAYKEAAQFLIEGEEIEKAYPLWEDFIIFTNYRILFIDNKFASSKKGITSIYYNKITSLSLSRGGFMKFSSDFEVYVGSKSYEFKLGLESDSAEVYRLISKKLSH